MIDLRKLDPEQRERWWRNGCLPGESEAGNGIAFLIIFFLLLLIVAVAIYVMIAAPAAVKILTGLAIVVVAALFIESHHRLP